MAAAVQHINQFVIDPETLIRKRHKEFEAFTVPLCEHCMKGCIRKFLIRYPIAAAGDEVCCCPCRKLAA
jgi:hypothetical protein